MNDITLISRAWNFSAERHAKQKRKGEAQEPYINHLAEVAELVAIATEGQDANLVAAAVLHDTIEDTATLSGELVSVFNADIANLVAEVTDDKKLSKAERKNLQVEHAATKSTRAKILKLADKTSNLRSLVKSPPTDWSLQRRQEYLDWSLKVAKGLRGVNSWLETQFDEAVEHLTKLLRDSDEGGSFSHSEQTTTPSASSETVHEKFMKAASKNPRFKEVKNAGIGFMIVGAKPPTKI